MTKEKCDKCFGMGEIEYPCQRPYFYECPACKGKGYKKVSENKEKVSNEK